jgi:ribonuclease P protein component
MIRKKFRLRGQDFKKFFSGNFRKYKDKDFLILYKKNNSEFPRFSVVVKDFKKAVLRNKIRRRIYSLVENLIRERIFSNYDFLIFPQKDLKYKELKTKLLEIFKRLNHV